MSLEEMLARMRAESEARHKENFPVVATDFEFADGQKVVSQRGWSGHKCGELVKIRPCAEEYGDKTYLGIYLGDIATGIQTFLPREETCEVQVKGQEPAQKHIGVVKMGFSSYNPAIYVLDKKCIVFGYESWWGSLGPDDNIDEMVITDDDIQNVFYVKMLKNLAEEAKAEDKE